MKRKIWLCLVVCGWLALGAVCHADPSALTPTPIPVVRPDAEQFLNRFLDALASQDTGLLLRLVAENPEVTARTLAALRESPAGENRAAMSQLATLIESLQRLAAAAVGNPEARELERLDGETVALARAGRHAEALATARQALALAERLFGAESTPAARVLNHIAVSEKADARLPEAEADFRRVLAILEKTTDAHPAELAAAHNNLAGVLETAGRYDEAETHYRRALTLDELAKADVADRAVHLNNLAGLFYATGRHVEAEPIYRQVLTMLEAARGPDHPEVATALGNYAVLLKTLGKYAEAEPLYRRALVIDEQALPAGHADIATRVNNLAALLHSVGRDDEAEALFRRALAMDEAALGPDHPGLAVDLNNLALVFAGDRRTAEAEAYYRRAYRIALGANDPGLRWTVESNLGALHAQSDPALAIFYGKRAVETLQMLRGNLGSAEAATRKSFLASVEKPYQHLANLLIEAGRLDEAQSVLKLLKEDEYRDFLRRDGRIDAGMSRIAYSLAERRWAGRLDALVDEGVRLAASHEPADDLRGKREQLDRRIAVWFAEVGAGLADDARLHAEMERGEREAALARHRARFSSLGRDVALLEYLLAGDRLHILVSTAASTRRHSLAIDGKALYRQLVAFRQALETPGQDPRPLGRELYARLIGPVDADLKAQGVRTLMLSLEGALRYIPFAALYDGRRYLVEDYALGLHTAAAPTKAVSERGPWRLAALGTTQRHRGFSALPGVKREIAALLGPRGLPGEAHLDRDFTAEQMRRSLRGHAPVLHVASHFMFVPGNESDSFLLLGDGERLSLRHIREGDFPFEALDLLTLSACETAMAGGREADGREVEGFGALAQNKGAAAVLATLWSIADDSTPELMREFYSQHEQGRISKAEALRRAQIKLIRGTPPGDSAATGATAYTGAAVAPYGHPFFWAPFILMGNWL